MPKGVYKRKPLSEEHKQKIREKMFGKQNSLGYKHSHDAKLKMSEDRSGEKHPMYGKKHSDDSKLKMSARKKGIVPSHLTDYWKGRKQTKEHRDKSVKNLIPDNQKGKQGFWKGKNNEKVSGSNHYKYIDGRSKNKEYRSWVSNLHNHRKKCSEGSHTFEQWQQLKIDYNFTCPMCLLKEPNIKLTKDHVQPLSKGGSDYIENIQPLCSKCNMKKHAKLMDRLPNPNIRLND